MQRKQTLQELQKTLSSHHTTPQNKDARKWKSSRIHWGVGFVCSIGQKDLKIVSKQKSPKFKSPIRVANFFPLLWLDKPKMGCNKFYVQCSALPLHTIKLPTVWQSSLSCKKSLTHSLPNKPNSSPHKSPHLCVPPSCFLLQPLAKQQLAIYPSKIHRVSSEVAPVAKIYWEVMSITILLVVLLLLL